MTGTGRQNADGTVVSATAPFSFQTRRGRYCSLIVANLTRSRWLRGRTVSCLPLDVASRGGAATS